MRKGIQKVKTGITGLDEITTGGLPEGRPTLICGGPGCGKTLMALEFIVNGVTQFNEPGVFIAFEEKAEELAENVASLGFDLDKLQKEKKLRIDYVHIDKTEIAETGEYDLDGLFIRLSHAVESIGAKRIVLDTIENIFAGLSNEGIIRAELRRLFQWLKDKELTAIITGEKGEGTLTRNGLEEYVSDCVIVLDHRIENQISTRRLRIIKYRGTLHGTNEYPFLIDQDGLSILPITSLRLDKPVHSERVPTGIPSLDEMFEGKGYYKGSSILLSGTAGSGKTSLAASFVEACCQRGKKAMIFGFEESPQQIIRNMSSIGVKLDRFIKKGLLQIHSFRPGLYGLEMHLARIHKLVMKFRPEAIVIDPVTNFISIGHLSEVNAMLLRLIDNFQANGITFLMTALNKDGGEDVNEKVSSLVDTWISLRDVELNGERNGALYVIKSRGMKHSKQVRELIITSDGIKLIDVIRTPEGRILVGNAREMRENEIKNNDPKKNNRRKVKR
jgi:circadian clock protein KaiC